MSPEAYELPDKISLSKLEILIQECLLPGGNDDHEHLKELLKQCQPLLRIVPKFLMMDEQWPDITQELIDREKAFIRAWNEHRETERHLRETVKALNDELNNLRCRTFNKFTLDRDDRQNIDQSYMKDIACLLTWPKLPEEITEEDLLFVASFMASGRSRLNQDEEYELHQIARNSFEDEIDGSMIYRMECASQSYVRMAVFRMLGHKPSLPTICVAILRIFGNGVQEFD